MDVRNALTAFPIKTLWKVGAHLNGGGLGFDYNRDPRGKKGAFIEWLATTFTVEQIVAAVRVVGGAEPTEPVTESAPTEPSASKVAEEVTEPVPAPAAPAPSDTVSVGPVPAPGPILSSAPAADPQPASASVESEVSRVLNLPFTQIRLAIGDLIERANKPPVVVEKVVKELVEKTVDRVVYADRSTKVDAASGRLSPVSQGMKACAEVFGVKVPRPDGTDTMVEVFDCPTDAPDQHYRFDVRTLRLFLSAMRNGNWAWLYGPPGTGKTEFLRNVAARLGRPFFRVNFDGALERYELIGGERLKAGSTEWLEGILTIALTTPHAIVDLDEVSFGRPEHLSAMHGVLEPHGTMTIPETGRVIARAVGVYIAATDNTNGGGDLTGAFAGTRPMNRAFVNRFATFIRFDYLDAPTEAKLLVDRTGIPLVAARMLTDFAARARVSVTSGDLPEAPSLRVMVPLAQTLGDGVDLPDAFDAVVSNRMDVASAEALRQIMRATIDAAAIKRAFAS